MDARIKQISHKAATFKTDETGYTEINQTVLRASHL